MLLQGSLRLMDTFVLIAVPLATAVLGFAFWLAVLSMKSAEKDKSGREGSPDGESDDLD